MTLISVPAVYDGREVRLLEAPPVQGPYRVLVTFVEPAGDAAVLPPDRMRFWASFNQWRDDRPIDDTLNDIRGARQSKSAPPPL